MYPRKRNHRVVSRASCHPIYDQMTKLLGFVRKIVFFFLCQPPIGHCLPWKPLLLKVKTQAKQQKKKLTIAFALVKKITELILLALQNFLKMIELFSKPYVLLHCKIKMTNLHFIHLLINFENYSAEK